MINRYASLRQGLVGAWCPSLGASGFRLIDRSGYGNHGTLTNMDPGTDWVPSGGKLALDFDVSNDYVSVGDIAIDGLSSISIAFFFQYITRSSDYAHLLGKNSSSSSRFGVGLTGAGTTNNRTNLLLTMGNGSNAFGYTTDNFIADNVWTHAVYLFDGTQASNATRLRLFVNGNEKSLTYSGTIPTTSPTNSASLVFGAETTATFFSNSQLDDIRVYNRALTPSEIRLLYTGGRGVGLAPERIKHRRKTSAAAFNRRRRIIIGASQ